MPIFVLIRERGPRWDASRGLREQDAWDEHAAFMEALADEGFIVLGGPLGEDRVMHVVVGESEERIVERLAGRSLGADGPPAKRLDRALARPAREAAAPDRRRLGLASWNT